MSGFLPDLASWALRGGAADSNENENRGSEDVDMEESAASVDVLTDEEMRSRRLARMGALQQQEQQKSHPQQPLSNSDVQQGTATTAQILIDPVPMDMEDKKPASEKSSKSKMLNDSGIINEKNSKTVSKAVTDATAKHQDDKGAGKNKCKEQKKRKAKDSNSSSSGESSDKKKVQKKKEILLKKTLAIRLAGALIPSDPSCVEVMLEDTAITVQSIAEILAVRLSMSADASQLCTMPPQKALIPYLGQCHRRASEELKTLRQSNKSKSAELVEILEAIKRQVVNYAASCLRVPELFEMGNDARLQLAKCLTLTFSDVSNSITLGVAGTSSSFYYRLCEELVISDQNDIAAVVEDVVAYFTTNLLKYESILDEGNDGSALMMVSALTSLCIHKKAAEALLNLPNFHLPSEDSPEANQVVRPPGADILRLLTGENRPYLRRSGPALEKKTILGLVLRLGIPKNNTAFSPTSILRQSLDTVERINSQQRQRLKIHQDASNQFIFSLVKSGPGAPAKVMRWFVDALLVNVGASALRPDTSKVSSSSTLLNASVALLKLCEPFVSKEGKHHLIDPSFVSAPEAHMGVYTTTGDDAVPRLGENSTSTVTGYNPKNKFIPQCFFFAARFLHLGIVPLLSYHENLLRHISHAHWELTSQNRDVQSDPHFSILVSKQRINEVALFQEELVLDTSRFCNLMGRVLFEMDDDVLRSMPEHFVDNTCDILMSISKMKPSLLRNLEFRYVFKLVVKLLSPKYTSIVRNYNLRAMLGDVLYELYLPSSTDDRPVATDRRAGGQVYLLSDKTAQETLAPSLLLLYGEVEHTGYYDKMSHRAKIASLIKYLWESSEHRPAFRRITQNKESFIKFANGIMNETNTLIATVMQKLPEIREAQMKMKNTSEWGQLSEEDRNVITSRMDDNEREVKHALPLCNKTLQMFGYLNTDRDIRILFLLEELCPRLVTMLLHVLTKLVGAKGLGLKVDNPEQYDFRPKEMLRDLCAIFALFASAKEFQIECAKSGCKPELLKSAVKTCNRLNLLVGESMTAFESLPVSVEMESKNVAKNEALLQDAPEDFKDEILDTFMKDPIILPSGHYVDRSTITQHLLNDPIDPFNRVPMTLEDIKPATELKLRMDEWLEKKRAASTNNAGD